MFLFLSILFVVPCVLTRTTVGSGSERAMSVDASVTGNNRDTGHGSTSWEGRQAVIHIDTVSGATG
jgi:hypothetical protein